jgi:hypothetical protein
VSVNVRVVLLVRVRQDSIQNGYKCINEKMDYHILSKIRRAFRRSVPFLKIFEGPTSVGVIIVLLVEDDLTLYKMVTNVSTKRWTITSYPKFDEPFGVRFHF